jgi:hypothetical protein
VTATLDGLADATDVTPASTLRFDVIKPRAAQILKIPVEDVSDIVLGELFGVSRETVWRWNAGRFGPRGTRLRDMANYLGLTVEEIVAAKAPSTPPTTPVRPAAPTTPTAPARPKKAAA